MIVNPNEETKNFLSTLDKFDINKYRYKSIKDIKKEDILKVSREFESIFINLLFKSMRKTVQKSDWLNGGLKEEIFNDMLDYEYSRMIAHSGGIGLGDMVYRFLISVNNSQTPHSENSETSSKS